ncbi:MAG: iron ABC transporter permease [Victivallaceae bacterium]|nr:iron ABC transporter permease [Victivallaceae bacterium]
MKHTLVIFGIFLLTIPLGMIFGSYLLLPADFYSLENGWNIVAVLRFFRMVAAFSVGGALALSGMVFQAVLRNPLAEPFTLGLSGGAGVGAVLAFLLGLQSVSIYSVPLAALAGALAVLMLVLLISCSGGTGGSESLLLSGVIAGTISASVLMYLVSTAENDQLANITWWMLGDLQSVDPALLAGLLCVLAPALLFLRWRAGGLDLLSLGDETAFYAGENPRRQRIILIVIASLLAAGTVALAGIISFCGLVIPHVVRRIYGSSHRDIVFKVFLWGGIFLMCSDILSRSIFVEREIPIGVITSLVGGPVFLWLLNRRRREC